MGMNETKWRIYYETENPILIIISSSSLLQFDQFHIYEGELAVIYTEHIYIYMGNSNSKNHSKGVTIKIIWEIEERRCLYSL